MAPVIIHSLGNYDYGVWEMVFAVVGYMGLLDFGLTPAIIRNVARQNAFKDALALRRIYSSSFAFFSFVGMASAAILLVASLRPQIFFSSFAQVELQKYSIFLIIVAIQVFFNFFGLVFDAFLEGLQCYSLRNGVTIITSIIGSLFMYPLLKLGGGLLILAAGNAIGFSLKVIFYWTTLRRKKYGHYRFRFSDVNLETFKELFLFGFKSFLYALSFMAGRASDKLIIGACLGPSIIPFYSIPLNLLTQIRNLIWSAARIFMPLFSELDANNEKEQIKTLLFNASRYGLAIIFPVLIGVCLLGPDFIRYWIGVKYAENGASVLYIMTAAYFLQWLCPFRNRFLTGIGQLDLQVRLGVIGTIINIIISITLVNYFGKEGVALGTLLSGLIIEPWLLWHTCIMAYGTLAEYFLSVISPLILPCLIHFIFLFFIKSFFLPKSLLMVITIACLSIIIYLPLFFLFGLRKSERKIIINIFSTQR